MQFYGFRPEALDFLIENKLSNNKIYYEAHKEQYITQIKRPFYLLAENMLPVMLQIDQCFITDPRRILSRIRRDTRFSKDKTLYRDKVWIAFVRDKKKWSSSPCCYFEMNPDGFSYGIGYYNTPSDTMSIYRDMILQENAFFLKAEQVIKVNSKFILDGKDYKRPKCPNAPQKYQKWLNKRELGLHYKSQDYNLLFTGDFLKPMLDDFLKVAPFYHFLQAIETRKLKS